MSNVCDDGSFSSPKECRKASTKLRREIEIRNVVIPTLRRNLKKNADLFESISYPLQVLPLSLKRKSFFLWEIEL